MTGWHEGHLISFDVESTSKNPLIARIVTPSLVVVEPGNPKATVLEWMVAVDEEIPESASAIHGITTEEARAKGRPLALVLAEMDTAMRAAWLPDVPLIGQNVSYDLTVLVCERERCGMPPLTITELNPVIDLLVCDRAMDRYRKGSRSLVELCNAEVDRGLVHTDQWCARMSLFQSRFDACRQNLDQMEGR